MYCDCRACRRGRIAYIYIMDSESNHCPEDWANASDVKHLLDQILGNPLADHAEQVIIHLKHELLDAHVAGIVRAIERTSAIARSTNAQFNGGVALHTILYHLLGGAASGLRPPPGSYNRNTASSCKAGWAAATGAKDKFYKRLPNADAKSKKGDNTDLLRLQAAVFDPKEILAQIMSRRNKLTGKLESMAISIDEIADISRQWGSTPSTRQPSLRSPRHGRRLTRLACSTHPTSTACCHFRRTRLLLLQSRRLQQGGSEIRWTPCLAKKGFFFICVDNHTGGWTGGWKHSVIRNHTCG